MTKQTSNARRKARKKAQKQPPEKLSKKNNPGPPNANTNNVHGKKKRKRNAVNNKDPVPQAAAEEEEDDLLALAQAWASNTSPNPSATNNKSNHKNNGKKKPKTNNHLPLSALDRKDRKPPPFPSNLPVPSDGFLRDQDPYQKSFQAAMDTAYEGLVWEASSPKQESHLQDALQAMDQAGLFRTDVTQPAGLGAKLVPSYVTRCLLGDEGTTYRYLGLRMFAHPWNGGNNHSTSLTSALQSFSKLNTHLTERTQEHLADLKNKRQQRGEIMSPEEHSPSTFNVTLINKMTVHKRLREEPMFKTNKYSVGWHADSSLEHFSTIAVYHTLMSGEAESTEATINKKQSKKHSKKNSHTMEEEDWAVALRVTHDAEGPKAKRLGDISVETGAPPIAVSLPSGATYFMLDDYNHHHQHAVLAPSSSNDTTTVRFSSTHRLLRKGHTVQDILARCHKLMGALDSGSENGKTNPQHHGPKRWRSEQSLLTELENEWLRQFFIQGTEHKELLWDSYWKEPIVELFQYWEKLEARTLQVVTLLRDASVEHCQTTKSNNHNHTTTALATLAQVLGDRKKNASEAVYNPIAKLLLERAKTRDLWSKREKDSVFQRLPEDCHPIPFPVVYGSSNDHQKQKKRKDMDGLILANSPLPDGSSAFLTKLATQIQAWGDAYDSRDATQLPKDDVYEVKML